MSASALSMGPLRSFVLEHSTAAGEATQCGCARNAEALEQSTLPVDDLAPQIRSLRLRQERLLATKTGLEDHLSGGLDGLVGL